jgi:hypothetical protein
VVSVVTAAVRNVKEMIDKLIRRDDDPFVSFRHSAVNNCQVSSTNTA